MVGNIMIDLTTVNIDNNDVRFTLYWDEPFDNFVPIVNYTITINCNDASCPVMFTVTTTSASVSFITDLSMMTPLSVTATNTIGTSDPITIIITGELCIITHVYIHTYIMLVQIPTYYYYVCLRCMHPYVRHVRTIHIIIHTYIHNYIYIHIMDKLYFSACFMTI